MMLFEKKVSKAVLTIPAVENNTETKIIYQLLENRMIKSKSWYIAQSALQTPLW